MTTRLGSISKLHAWLLCDLLGYWKTASKNRRPCNHEKTLRLLFPPQRRGRGRAGNYGKGRKRLSLTFSQRYPRADLSPSESSNIFISLACSPSPLEKPKGISAEEKLWFYENLGPRRGHYNTLAPELAVILGDLRWLKENWLANQTLFLNEQVPLLRQYTSWHSSTPKVDFKFTQNPK